jgi:xylose isomerase
MASYFGLKKPIGYEGPDSMNPLAFHVYDRTRKVEGKTLEEWLRPSACYWHTMRGTGNDPFGGGPQRITWPGQLTSRTKATKCMDAFFELLELTGIPFYALHDTDVLAETPDFAAYIKEMEWAAGALNERNAKSGKKCLWTTQNAFSHDRYVHGAGTGVDAAVFNYAGAQVKQCLELGKAIDALGHVFWDGRGGFSILQNRRMAQDLARKAMLMRKAVEYKKAIGWDGKFYIEPKPKEPTSLQYDSDVPGCLGFLHHFGLANDYGFNVESNHATLAGHPFEFDLAYASMAGKLDSIDANEGDMLLGWDTDNMPRCIMHAAKAWLVIMAQGGFTTGGTNFDAKVRRASLDAIDRIKGLILALDTHAAGLMVAAQIRKEGKVEEIVADLYSSYESEAGKTIDSGNFSLGDCEKAVLAAGGNTPDQKSGREEEIEQYLNGAFIRAMRAL